MNSDVRRTLLALLASAMGAVPLCELVSDKGWLLDVWLTMLIVIGPAALLRARRGPSAAQIWLGMVLLVPWLTARFLSHHAFGGIIPTGATWHDIRLLMTDLHNTTTKQAAPVQATPAITLALCTLLGLVAALVDLVAVVGRRGALAGVPLLVVFTVSGAVPRQPVSWYLFAIAAAGFLILLGLDSSDDLHRWGHYVPRPNRLRSRTAETGQRVGAVAIALAVIVPAFVPSDSGNLLADLFHDSGSNGLDTGLGRGNGGTGGIDPFVGLSGQLNRKEPINLFNVTVRSSSGSPAGANSGTQLFYARTNVLSDFDKSGWRVGDQGGLEALDSTRFASSPGTEFAPNTTGFSVHVDVTNLTSNPPLFAQPTSVSGLNGDTRWSPQDQLLEGSRIEPGDSYDMTVQQPTPSVESLQDAGRPGSDLNPWLQHAEVTPYVQNLVDRLTANAVSSYARARAIYEYFTNPVNGFSYNLQTATANTGDELSDFLLKKLGYCQQFAAAMGIMLRVADVPARVVLGYTHAVPKDDGTFTVTTTDAHAWVEAYFDGIGWVPFDPTPLSGINGGARNDLPWASHPSTASTQPTSTPVTTPRTTLPSAAQSASAGPSANAASGVTNVLPTLLMTAALLVVLALVLLTPWAVRRRRRAHRLRRARQGDTDALWAELSDTATDLGYVWSTARTPRQVGAWLATPSGTAADRLQHMVTTVERVRYAPSGAVAEAEGRAMVDDLDAVRSALLANRARGDRVRAALLPASLGWTGPAGFLRSLGQRARRH